MKQLLQNLRDGTTEVTHVPAPGVSAGQLLIHTSASLISAGAERMLVYFGKANWIDKARQQPDKVATSWRRQGQTALRRPSTPY